MSGRKSRRGIEQVSLSFLDCICCGFGAIILLLVLAKTAEPMILEETRDDLEAMLADLQKQLVEIRGESTYLNRELVTKRESLSEITERIARLAAMISAIRSEFENSDNDNQGGCGTGEAVATGPPAAKRSRSPR